MLKINEYNFDPQLFAIMNIGIDAKWFFKGNPSGRVVVRNLVREVLQQDTENQYYIFLRSEDRREAFPFRQPNVHLVYIWAKNNLLSNLIVTPQYAKKLRLDVMLYQYFGPFVKRSKIITLIHDVIFESHPNYFSWREKLYFSFMRPLAKRADWIMTTSNNEKKRLVQFGYAIPQKIGVSYWGVDPRFSPLSSHSAESLQQLRSKLQLPERFVLYVGRLNYRKNIHTLIEAFQYVTDPSLKLVLAGGYDWKMFDVEAFVREKNLADKVQLLGFVDDEDLPGIYALSQAFCFLSYDEGFGLPPLEAMASGIPIIVANSGSLPEICGDAGVYVEPNSSQAIGQIINETLGDPTLLAQLRQKSIAQAARFSWHQTGAQYVKLFHSFDQNNS